MDHLRVNVRFKSVSSIIVLLILASQCTEAWNEEYRVHGAADVYRHEIITLDRQRRDAPIAAHTAPVPPVIATVPATTVTAVPEPSASPAAPANVTSDVNRTTNVTDNVPPSVPTVSVTQTPLLGVNGSGILKVNITENMPKVSDPIVPDDNFTDVFIETPERIKSEHNITNLKYDSHNFYNSSFIGNVTYFNEYWTNITKADAHVHALLSNSHRRATTVQLTFPFPFYGCPVRNITVASGGFLFTGEHVHHWLAATQYIAPLMGNFDTSLTNDSVVKLVDDGEKFSAFWENVSLQEDVTKKFTFAVTLYKNGDIIFAYKNIPIDVQEINDTEHPVKVGISDAYLNDNIILTVRYKTIYEYHRVSFKNYFIANNTLLKLVAQPTCLQYTTCDSCLNHDTGFNCSWCPQTQKCSSGTDRNKQDWDFRNCKKTMVTEATGCVALAAAETAASAPRAAPDRGVAYDTDMDKRGGQTVVHTTSETPSVRVDAKQYNAGADASAGAPEPRSPIGGVVVTFVAITLVVSLSAWILYAFKNPHTRSGQLLIKYRPSQWNWRRGEARYTAATIHM